jgi:hypothetical protein
MFNTAKVKLRYDELRAKVTKELEEDSVFTIKGLLECMKDILDRNIGEDDKIALETIKTAGKHLGMFVDKVEHSGKLDITTKSNMIDKYLEGDED